MKKILPLILLPLVLSSCGSVSSSSEQFVPTPYTSKTANAYYFDASFDTTFEIRYFNGSVVPYISMRDYLSLLYRGRKYQQGRDYFSLNRDGSVYTVEVAGGYKATVDTKQNYLESDNLWGFKNTNLTGIGDKANVSYDGLPFCRVKSVSREGEIKKTRIDFGKYDLKVYGDENAVYLPIAFATDLFSNENILQGAFNGHDLYFFNYTENEDPSDIRSSFYEHMYDMEEIPQEYADYYYNELCLDYDTLLGRPGRSSLEKYYDLSKGLDKALEERPLGRTIKSYLKSTEVPKILAGADLLGLLRMDGGHSSYDPLTTEYYITYPDGHKAATRPTWLGEAYSESARLVREESAKGYQEIDDRCELFRHHSDIYKARKDKLGKAEGPLKGHETYTKKGDIAYIHIDGFMGEIGLQNEWKDYYEGKRPDIPFGEGIGGAVGAISYGLNQAHNDSSVKYVVVDLSANTGGSTDEMLFMIKMLTGDGKFYEYNTLSQCLVAVEYEFDLNFDKRFDENDNAASLLEGKDLSVLTTRNGFSCGGISPVYLHENGAFTIGEECGGGSCSIYMQYDAYGNLNRASCPAGTCTKDSVSIDEARLTVCDSKMNFPFDGTSYDYSSLFDTATLRQLIEAHYQSA